ncbi:MAG: DUF6503 family protein [Terriglobia bacterium]
MKRSVRVWGSILFTLLVVAPSSAAEKEFDPAGSDAKAVELVDAMQAALGGRKAWARVRYLWFDWVVERGGQRVAAYRHLWDRYQGYYRVQGETREGKEFLALFNVQTRKGNAWVDGKKLAGEELQKALQFAYGRYINDTYWLVQPMKLKDPGVHLGYAGTRELKGTQYDVVHVWFDPVGLTPGDHYWVFIHPKTKRIDRWAYFLESYKDRGEPRLEAATAWDWRDWQPLGGVWLARDKVRDDGSTRIWFPVLRVLETVEADVFASPNASLPDSH